MHTAKLAASLLVLLALVLGATPARAETVNCTHVTALPAVITGQGVYCFTGDLTTGMTSNAAIDIQTNNVVLDLNGFKLGGLAAGPNTGTIGIEVNNRQNITIKNGTIRGFQVAIRMLDAGLSQGHVVEDVRADQNTTFGMLIQGSGHIIRNNQVVATGGGPQQNAFGIAVKGAGTRVLNNDVIRTVTGAGITWGIFFEQGTTGALAVNNRITEAERGIDYNGGATGKFRDNLTFGVTTPFLGGTNAGNNN